MLSLSRVGSKSQGSGEGHLSGSGLWFRFVRPAWWQTMPNCPVLLDPGPGVRNQLRREWALRSGDGPNEGSGKESRCVRDKGAKGTGTCTVFSCVACLGR